MKFPLFYLANDKISLINIYPDISVVAQDCIIGVNYTTFYIGIKFAKVYWDKINNETPEETQILMGDRIIEMIGKFYTHFALHICVLYSKYE